MLSLYIDQRYIFSLGYIFSNFDLYSGGRNFVVEGKRLSMPRIRFMVLSKYWIPLLNRFIHCLYRLAQKGRAVLRLPLLHKLIYNNV